MAFLSPIKHNLATHHGSENLVVKVTTDGGVTGFGEGVPRAFVTGETLAASLAFLKETLAPPEQMAQLFHLVKLHGMRFLKLKVGTPEDLQILAQAREELGWDLDLRVDANCAWSPAEAIDRLREMAPFRLSAVEQPVAKEDFEGLRKVQDVVGLPVIADESLCTEADAQRLIDLKACQIFNLRLSKCGGLAAARRLRQLAEKAGVSCQLGCHVGETSILSAAGRHFALCSPRLAYLEGSFSPFLLRRDPVAEPVTFDHGGAAGGLPGPGLGVEVLDSVLDEMAVSREAVP